MVCSGNSSEFCGSGGHLDLYQVKLTLSSSTVSTSLSTASTSTLSGSQSSSVTASTTTASTSTLSGSQSSSVSASTTTASTSSGSQSSSVSASTTTSSSLSSRTTSSSSLAPLSTGLAYYSYIDCHTDSVNSRTINDKSEVSYSMTLDLCATFCGGYIFFGVEFGRECYCGNTLLASSTTATDGRCNMQCLGNSAQICGGSNGLSLYGYSAIVNPSSSSSPTTSSAISSAGSTISTRSTSSSATVSTTTTPTGPSHVPSVGSYMWIGCYTDQIGNRALTALTETNHATMTVEICASFCSSYAMFGVEYSKYPLKIYYAY
jgi:WSC domain